MDSKTLTHPDGRVALFGIDDFVDIICGTDCCFVCGAPNGTTEFNDEHIIPQWILKRYDLYHRTMRLPNGERKRYDTYTIRCCWSCNSLLGSMLEVPMSNLLAGGFERVSKWFEEASSLQGSRVLTLYAWLCLLFIKTHLKDREMREHLDRRKGDARIADQYDWATLHHIYTLARSPYVQPGVDPYVIGTILIYKIEDDTTSEAFDYFDLTNQHTIVLRLGDVGVVAVLTDSCASAGAWDKLLHKLRGKTLKMIQLREVAARLAVANHGLQNRPRFFTQVDRDAVPATVSIHADLDECPRIAELDHALLGDLMLRAVGDMAAPEDLEKIKSGQVTYLVDDSGEFRDLDTEDRIHPT